MADRKSERRGLGRGLSALMADVGPESGTPDAPKSPDRSLPVEKLVPNPDQPRRLFHERDLEELTASIAKKGVIQPLIVRPKAGSDGLYEIVAGERRWRAAQRARLHTLPVVIRDLDDTEVLELAIIENIQRADLNPIEEAFGYQQLQERFGHTQEKVAEALGKSRSYIANLLRLLTLPDKVQDHVREGRLTAGHARALVTADKPEELAAKVIGDSLSVRETERLAKGSTLPKPKVTSRTNVEKDADTRALEGDLSANLGMSVALDHSTDQGSGKLTISYKTLEQLDALCDMLTAPSRRSDQ